MLKPKKAQPRNTTIEDLAGMIKRGFDETAKKVDVDRQFADVDRQFADVDRQFADVDRQFADTHTRFNKVEARLDHIDARLATIERDVKDIIHREEFDDLMARVKYLERKMGIQSGK